MTGAVMRGRTVPKSATKTIRFRKTCSTVNMREIGKQIIRIILAAAESWMIIWTS
jgi:hypothetical protein